MMKRIGIVVIVFAVLAVLWRAQARDSRAVMSVADHRQLSFDRMIEKLAGSRAVFVGEVHNLAEHHAIELEVIRQLHAAGRPLMIGLEMFRADAQEGLDRWVAGTLDEASFRKLYGQNWNLPWPLYRDILLFAREKKIPLIGLNIDEGVAAKVARTGFSSLSPQEKAKLPPGISCNVDETYEEFIRRAHGHSMQNGKAFRNFCEAQMVWDSSMAYTLAAALERSPGRTAVVLAGSGHAWRRGIPAQLSQFLPDLRTSVVLPMDEDGVASGKVTPADADFLVL